MGTKQIQKTPDHRPRRPKTFLSEPEVAEIVSMRGSGQSVRAISRKTGRTRRTVARALSLPQSRAELEQVGAECLSKFRAQYRSLVPLAMQVVANALDEGDVRTALRLLDGTQTAISRSDSSLEVTAPDPYDGRSKQDMAHFIAWGHWLGAECTEVCQQAPHKANSSEQRPCGCSVRGNPLRQDCPHRQKVGQA